MSLRLITLIILLPLTMACSSSQSADKSNSMIGIYVFDYPSGQVEVLTIISDTTYRKDIYINQDQFNKKSNPIYTNDGKWSIVSGNKLVFNDWLMYNEMRYPDIILNKPYKTAMKDVFWIESTDRHNEKIIVYDETGYVFVKRF